MRQELRELTFWARVTKTRTCWLWIQTADSRQYGQVFGTSAHRFAYELKHGKLPRGAVLCHRCDNPACVRPSHLFVGNGYDNVLDSYRKGRRTTDTFIRRRDLRVIKGGKAS